MGQIGRLQRDYAKGMMKRLNAGGSMVSDAETQQFQQQAQQQSNAVLNAQQGQIQQAAKGMATGGTNVASPTFAGATKALGQAGADAAVRASGQAQQYRAGLEAQRRGEALGVAAQTQQLNMAKTQAGFDMGMQVVDTAAKAVGSFTTLGVGGGAYG